MASVGHVSGSGQMVPFLSPLDREIENHVEAFLLRVPFELKDGYRTQIMEKLEQIPAHQRLDKMQAVLESFSAHMSPHFEVSVVLKDGVFRYHCNTPGYRHAFVPHNLAESLDPEGALEENKKIYTI